MDMERWVRVRRNVLVNGSKRSVMSKGGLHWETLQKMLSRSKLTGYQRVVKRSRKINLLLEGIGEILRWPAGTEPIFRKTKAFPAS